jgi:hypothetical protein
VSADARVGARTDALLPFGLGLGGIGLLALAGGVLLMVSALRRSTGMPPVPAPADVPALPAGSVSR